MGLVPTGPEIILSVWQVVDHRLTAPGAAHGRQG